MKIALLAIPVILFCVTACGINEAEVTIIENREIGTNYEPEPIVINEPPLEENETSLYYEYRARISTGLNNFANLITIDEDIDPEPQLIIESRTILGLSEQGGELTRFTTLDGNVFRYTLQSFGEWGQSIASYYYFDDGLEYVQRLSASYADKAFRVGNRFDILQYQLINIIVEDGEFFLIDDVFKQAEKFSPEGCIQIFSLETLDYFFENYEDEFRGYVN